MFRYADRYQTSLRQLWRDPTKVEDLLALLEQRDQDLEDYIDRKWSYFVPDWTNLDIGNAVTNFGRISVRPDLWCNLEINFVVGTTSSIGGDVSFTLPNGLHAAGYSSLSAHYEDSTTRFFMGACRIVDDACALVHAESGNLGIVDATNPFTWTTNDAIVITGGFPLR